MVDLSEGTQAALAILFAPEDHERVSRLLELECGDNLPFCDTPDRGPLIERIRQAVLKLSGGDYGELEEAIGLAKIDWRDALVAAGFGDETLARLAWQPED